MEYLKFGSRSDQTELGRRLAQMHLATPAVRLTTNAACELAWRAML